MPEIIATHEFLGKQPLRLVINFLKPENSGSWEGWVDYEIRLYNGDESITSISDVTIIDDDVEQLFATLSGEELGEFEPIEPDFHLSVQPIINERFAYSGENLTELLIFLDEGKHRGEGYVGHGLGFRLLANKGAVSKFVQELDRQYRALTNGLKKT